MNIAEILSTMYNIILYLFNVGSSTNIYIFSSFENRRTIGASVFNYM